MSDSNSGKNVRPNFPFLRPSRAKGLLSRLYYVCVEYRSVIVFGLVLLGLVMLSYWLSRYIPYTFYNEHLVPMFYAATLLASVWAAAALLIHSEGIRARKILGYVFVFWSIIEVGIIVINFMVDDPIMEPSHLRTRTFLLIMGNICAWMLLIYPTEALRPGWLTVTKAFALLLPAILLAVLYYGVNWDIRILIMSYPLLVFATILHSMRGYRKWCEDNFSALDDVDLHWIWRYLVMLFIICLSYYYLCYSTHPTRSFTQMWLLLFMIIYTTDNVLFRHDLWHMVDESDRSQQRIDPETGKPLGTNRMHELGELRESEYKAYRKLLDDYMEREKPYLNKDLRLSDLNVIIPLNRSYLSQFINAEYGCNFYQLVNSYRIREAKRLIIAHPEMKLQDIADRTGFSSPTVFSRSFLRQEGITPSEWPVTRNPERPSDEMEGAASS